MVVPRLRQAVALDRNQATLAHELNPGLKPRFPWSARLNKLSKTRLRESTGKSLHAKVVPQLQTSRPSHSPPSMLSPASETGNRGLLQQRKHPSWTFSIIPKSPATAKVRRNQPPNYGDFQPLRLILLPTEQCNLVLAKPNAINETTSTESGVPISRCVWIYSAVEFD